ncbi:unnamed protein product [Rotaria sp. Silwood2]|nr:unnamed protein product [Rotaria sp. Silwood2]CAF4755415.1 unnamed protein product [Rotaria sp. Silwood2]
MNKNFFVDDADSVDFSSLNFEQNRSPREKFEKISTLVYEMIQTKESYVSMKSNENRIIEYVKHHLNEIDLLGCCIVNQLDNIYELEILKTLFSSDEEKHEIQWILSFIEKDDERNHKIQSLIDIFVKSVLSWLEEFSALKFSLVKDKILKRYATEEERQNKDVLDKFENFVQMSQFFIENRPDDWFEIMRDITLSNQIEISLNDLMKIISILPDFQELSIVKQIINKKKTNKRLFNILFARITYNLTRMLRGNVNPELVNKLSHLKETLQFEMDPKCLFTDIFGQLLLDYENQEAKVLEII